MIIKPWEHEYVREAARKEAATQLRQEEFDALVALEKVRLRRVGRPWLTRLKDFLLQPRDT